MNTHPLLNAKANWSMASNRLVSAPGEFKSPWLNAVQKEI